MSILKLFLEFLPLVVLGYLLGRFKPGFSSYIARPLVQYGVPFSLMGLLLNTGIDWSLLRALLIASLLIGCFVVVFAIIQKTGCFWPHRIFLLGSVFGNSGYFGIPVALALLPSESLGFSIGYDLGATLLVWSVGPIVLSSYTSEWRRKGLWASLFGAFFRSPAFKGLVGALLLQCTPWVHHIASFLWLPSRVVIALALIIVGVRLNSFDISSSSNKNLSSLAIFSLLIKLVIFPACMLVLSYLLNLPILMRDALVLQAASPTAISVLLLAEDSFQDQNIAAFLVAWSTSLSILTVPFWFLFLGWIPINQGA